MRAPPEQIPAPAFPVGLPWVNVAPLRMDKQLRRPVLIEFWDFCRVNSLRTLPYVKAWHERYAEAGLRVIGVHSPGFSCSASERSVRAACSRLEIVHPVCVDSGLELWREYGNQGWPARYLFDGRSRLFEFHHGEGAYQETERAIQELLGVECELVAPFRPEDAPDAEIVVQTPDQPGAYSGPYEAGGVWAVLEGDGAVEVNGTSIAVARGDCYPLIEHDRHTAGVLDLKIGDGVVCHATCFTPGAL